MSDANGDVSIEEEDDDDMRALMEINDADLAELQKERDDEFSDDGMGYEDEDDWSSDEEGEEDELK